MSSARASCEVSPENSFELTSIQSKVKALKYSSSKLYFFMNKLNIHFMYHILARFKSKLLKLLRISSFSSCVLNCGCLNQIGEGKVVFHTVVITFLISKLYFAANSRSLVSCAGTAITAQVP